MRLGLCITVLAAAIAVPASAADMPKRKSGLWDVKVTHVGTASAPADAQSMQMCVDTKTDNALHQSAAAGGKQSCTRQDVRQEGNRTVVDSVCKFGESTATTRAVFTGSFDSAYTVDIKTTYNPPFMGSKEGNTAMEARWVGPCKADQKPGDVILGNGMKINMNGATGK